MSLNKHAFLQGFLEVVSSYGYDSTSFEKVAEAAWAGKLPPTSGGTAGFLAGMIPMGLNIGFPMMADAGEKLEELEQERFEMEAELARRKKKQQLLEAQRGRI